MCSSRLSVVCDIRRLNCSFWCISRSWHNSLLLFMTETRMSDLLNYIYVNTTSAMLTNETYGIACHMCVVWNSERERERAPFNEFAWRTEVLQVLLVLSKPNTSGIWCMNPKEHTLNIEHTHHSQGNIFVIVWLLLGIRWLVRIISIHCR